MTQFEILYGSTGKNCFYRLGLWQEKYYNSTTILDLGDGALRNSSTIEWLRFMRQRGFDINDVATLGPILNIELSEKRNGEQIFAHLTPTECGCGIIKNDTVVIFGENSSEVGEFIPDQPGLYVFDFK